MNDIVYYREICSRAIDFYEKEHKDVDIWITTANPYYVDDITVVMRENSNNKKVNRVILNEYLDNIREWVILFDTMYRELTREKMIIKNNSVIHRDTIIYRDAFVIKKVIFNGKATIVYWEDGTKTVVKLQGLEWYDPEKGLAMAIAKKALGNKGNYYEIFKKWLPTEYFEIYVDLDEAMAVRADLMKEIAREARENSSDSIGKEEEDMTRTMRMNVVSLYNEGKLTHEIAEICNLTESEVVRIRENEGVLR